MLARRHPVGSLFLVKAPRVAARLRPETLGVLEDEIYWRSRRIEREEED